MLRRIITLFTIIFLYFNSISSQCTYTLFLDDIGENTSLSNYFDDLYGNGDITGQSNFSEGFYSWDYLTCEGVDQTIRTSNDAISDPGAALDAIMDSPPNSIMPAIYERWERGNDFNKKAWNEHWWPFDEVTVEHPTKKYPPGHPKEGKPRRFRLDGYDHDNGRIGSRKATTFDDITEQTWLNYVNEIDAKYPPGAVIKSPKSTINNKLLHGDYYLEVPDINKNSAKRELFEQLAADRNVTVIYKPE